MDKQIVSMLVCPNCRGGLKLDSENNELVCTYDGLAYPIQEGVPIMLESEARKMSEDEKLARARALKSPTIN